MFTRSLLHAAFAAAHRFLCTRGVATRTRLPRLVCAVAAMVVVIGVAARCDAVTWSLADDFSLTDNSESSIWSYRIDDNAGNFPLLTSATLSANQLWGTGFASPPLMWSEGTGYWGIGKNDSGVMQSANSVDWAPGEILFHPKGAIPGRLVVGWLAPEAMTIDVDFTFAKAMNAGASGIGYAILNRTGSGDVVIQDFTPIGDYGVSLSDSLVGLSVAAGDRLFFRFDNWGDAGGDIGRAAITITGTPLSTSLTWNGALSSAWNTAVQNWQDGSGTPLFYSDGASVVFDDSVGLGSTTVDVSGAGAAPASVLFNNTEVGYVLQSAGGTGITGETSLTKRGSGTLSISGANTYSGGTNLNAGTIVVQSVAANLGSGALNFTGGKLKYADGAAAETIDRSITLNAGGTIDTNGIAVEITTAISGGGSLTKTGAGTLSLAGPNTYTGNTTINGGTLSITGVGGIYNGTNNSTGIVQVNSGAILEVDRWDGGQLPPLYPDIDPVLWGTGSFGQLFFNSNQIVINGGTIRYLGATNLHVADVDGRGFTIGAGGATLEAATANETWHINRDDRNANYGIVGNGGTLTLTGAGNGVIDKVIPGTGGLTKSGAGTWTLTAANTYAGPTTVEEGTLVVASTLQSATASSTGIGDVTLNGGILTSPADATAYILGSVNAGSGPHLVSPGGGDDIFSLYGKLSVGGLALNANSTLRFDILDSLSLDQILNSGALSYSGEGTATFQVPGGLPNGMYKLMSFDTTALTDAGAFSLSSLGGVLTDYALNLNLASKELNLIVGSARIWSGATDGVWNTSVENWKDTSGNAAAYFNGSQVLFDDTVGEGPTTVDIATADVQPDTVTFANSVDYTLQSSGGFGIAGPASLTKNGPGKLILLNSNTYAGGSNLNGGTVVINSTAALGAGAIIFGGGTLQYADDAEAETVDRWITLNAGGGKIDTNGNTVEIVSAIDGPGGLTKTGAGTLALGSTVNSYTGPTTVNGGTLSLADGLIYSNFGWGNQQIAINNGGTIVIGGWGDGFGSPQAGLGQVSFLPGNLLIDNGTLRYTGAHESGTMDRGFTIGPGGATLVADGADANAVFTLNQGRNFGIASANSGTLTLTGDFDGVMNLNIPGAGKVVKDGPGTWALTGVNTYSGGTEVKQGTLQGNATSLQGAIVLAGNSSLVFDQNVSDRFSGAISGAGSVTKQGAGTLTVTAAQTYKGPTVISNGVLRLQRPHTWSLAEDFSLAENSEASTWSYRIDDNAAPPSFPLLPTNTQNANTVWGTAFANPPLMWSEGTGYWAIGRNDSGITQDSANLSWSAGEILFHPKGEIPGRLVVSWLASEAMTVDVNYLFAKAMNVVPDNGIGYAILKRTADGDVVIKDFTYIGNFGTTLVDSLSALSVEAGDRLFFRFDNWGNAGGDIARAAITINADGGNNLLPVDTPLSIQADAMLDLGGTNQQVASLSDYNGSGGSVINGVAGTNSVLTLSPGDESATFTGAILGGGDNGDIRLVVAGTGTQVLAGANAYTGGTDVQAGTLEIAGADALPAGGSLTIGAAGTVVLGGGLSGGPEVGAVVAAVPEPGTFALLAAALLGLLVAAWRNRGN